MDVRFTGATFLLLRLVYTFEDRGKFENERKKLNGWWTRIIHLCHEEDLKEGQDEKDSLRGPGNIESRS